MNVCRMAVQLMANLEYIEFRNYDRELGMARELMEVFD